MERERGVKNFFLKFDKLSECSCLGSVANSCAISTVIFFREVEYPQILTRVWRCRAVLFDGVWRKLRVKSGNRQNVHILLYSE